MSNQRPPFHLPDIFAIDESHHLVDDFTMRAARQVHRANPSLPMYQPVPLRVNPMWDGNNELGFEAAFAPDAANRQTILKLGEWDAPQVWSVMLSQDYTNDDLLATNFSVTAEVQAGAGGAVDTILLDWNQGTSFSVVCNALLINAIYNDISIPPTTLRLRAIAGKRPIAGLPPARTFLGTALNTPGTFFSVRIPKYATSVEVLPRGTTSALAYDANMKYEAFLGVNAPKSTLSGTQLLALGSKFDLPGGANNFIVTNNTATAGVDFTLRFTLAL